MQPRRLRMRIPAQDVQPSIIRFERKAHRAIPTRDEPLGLGRQHLRETIRMEPLSPCRLQDERRLHGGDELPHSLAPTAVMREFHHIAVEIERPVLHPRCKPGRGLGLDVSREEDAHARRVIRTHDKRQIVVARCAEVACRPHDAATELLELDHVARRHLPHAHAPRRGALEQLANWMHALGRTHERPVHHELVHRREANHLEQPTEVVEVRVRHEDRAHPSTRLGDRGKERARRHAADRTRTSVEEDEFPSGTHEIRRAIADVEHRELK